MAMRPMLLDYFNNPDSRVGWAERLFVKPNKCGIAHVGLPSSAQPTALHHGGQQKDVAHPTGLGVFEY